MIDPVETNQSDHEEYLDVTKNSQEIKLITMPKFAYIHQKRSRIVLSQLEINEFLMRVVSPNGMNTSWDDPRQYWGKLGENRVVCYRNPSPGKINRRGFGPTIYCECNDVNGLVNINATIGRGYLSLVLFVFTLAALASLLSFQLINNGSGDLYAFIPPSIIALLIIFYIFVDKKFILIKELDKFERHLEECAKSGNETNLPNNQIPC